MKLHEILKVPPMTNTEAKILLSDENLGDAMYVGMMGGGHTVFRIDINHQMAFFCKDDNGPFCVFVVSATKICGIDGYLSRRIWTRSDMMQQGIASGLFAFIWKYLKGPIFSDEAQTPLGRALWASLSKRYPVKIMNTQTGEISHYDKINADQLYTLDDSESADFLLMLEKRKNPIIPKESTQDGILVPYRLFEEGDE